MGLSLLGLNSQDVVVRVSDRSWWDTFLEKHGVGEKERPSILRTLDRLDGATAEQRREKLGALARAVEEVWQGKGEDSAALREVHKGVKALGYGGWCETDYRVVRGLAYYTGVVFEVHDRAGKLRAVAGLSLIHISEPTRPY